MQINDQLKNLAETIKKDKIKYLVLPLIILTVIVLLLLYLSKDSAKTFPDEEKDKINITLPSVTSTIEDENISKGKFSMNLDSTSILDNDMSEDRVSRKEVRQEVVNTSRDQLSSLLKKMDKRKRGAGKSRAEYRDSMKYERDKLRMANEREQSQLDAERGRIQDSITFSMIAGLNGPPPVEATVEPEIDYSKMQGSSVFNSTSATRVENTIDAVIMGDHLDIVDGALVKMRIIKGGGNAFPKNSILFANAKFNGNRLDLSVNAQVNGSSIKRHNLSVYDYDGMKGINVPSNVKNEIRQGVMKEASQGLSIELPIIGNFATKFGSASVRIIKVDIADAYRVHLKRNNIDI